MVEGRRKSFLELPSLYFLILYHPIPDLSSCTLLLISLLILRNRKMEEVRGKMEDVKGDVGWKMAEGNLEPLFWLIPRGLTEVPAELRWKMEEGRGKKTSM